YIPTKKEGREHIPVQAENETELLSKHVVTAQGEIKNLGFVSELINETGDDRSNIQSSDKLVLIVEDDLRFAKIMMDIAHKNGLKAIVAWSYGEVFEFVNRYKPS